MLSKFVQTKSHILLIKLIFLSKRFLAPNM